MGNMSFNIRKTNTCSEFEKSVLRSRMSLLHINVFSPRCVFELSVLFSFEFEILTWNKDADYRHVIIKILPISIISEELKPSDGNTHGYYTIETYK